MTGRFFAWLQNYALPLWSTIGVDERGGFVEQLSPEGQVIADVRRARLVARQIFAFKSAGELGWLGPVDGLVRHGLTALLERHLTPEGDVVPRFLVQEQRGDGDFDLYDQAFVLFGLAHGFGHTGYDDLQARALRVLQRMRSDWTQPGGGFAEHQPARTPLKANPHMHLLEAALAWMDVSTVSAWRGLAAEIVRLCVSRFIDPETGSLHEYFDTEWNMLAGGTDEVVEPGHQAEWAWLLLRWRESQSSPGIESLAERLFEIAENDGLDPCQHRLVNELNADLSFRDRRLRLWPQTERIKALIAIHDRTTDGARRSDLRCRIASAVEALLGYFEHPIRGSWWEHFDELGKPVIEPARASSLYHIMGAANQLARFTGSKLC